MIKDCGKCALTGTKYCERCTDYSQWVPERKNKIEQKGVNPKDALGAAKNPHGCVSRAVLAEVGLAMMEGSRKYGRHNYRVAPVRAEVYFEACNRHLDAWWEGEDIDSDSGLPHLVKAIASLFVIRDAIIQGCYYDDRPPKTPAKHWGWIKKATAGILERLPESKPPYTEKEHGPSLDRRAINQKGQKIDMGCFRFCPECRKAIENAKDGDAVSICEECCR